MIVVSDTSSLTNLATIGRFDLLREIFGELYIPAAVWSELNHANRRWPGRDEVASAAWVHRETVVDTQFVAALTENLHRGEAEAIALALQLGASAILMDERAGRHHAERMGLRVIGVLGILLVARHRKVIPAVKPALDDLRQRAGFWVSEALYHEILAQAGESVGGENR